MDARIPIKNLFELGINFFFPGIQFELISISFCVVWIGLYLDHLSCKQW